MRIASQSFARLRALRREQLPRLRSRGARAEKHRQADLHSCANVEQPEVAAGAAKHRGRHHRRHKARQRGEGVVARPQDGGVRAADVLALDQNAPVSDLLPR